MLACDTIQPRLDFVRGARVGDYAIEETRALLRHVEIHRARHVVTGRTVALQLVRRGCDAAGLRAVGRELATLTRLRHARVAEILEVGALDDGRPYLAAEWAGGRSLQTAVDESGPLTLQETLRIAEQIAAALTTAHALGVVHGELHAEHVRLVAQDQAVKLIHFGMSRLSGTRLAPEQARGDAVDERADVFALGALVYQMVTGVRPRAEPPPPSCASDVPRALDEVLLRCLHAEPARRWEDVPSLMTALRAAVRGSELVAQLYVTATLDAAADDTRAREDAERALAVAQRWLERQRVAFVLAGAGAVVATARIPRPLEQQRAARASWVTLANAVREHMDARRAPHPAVRTRVQIRID
jgi:serine/threonine-protein kinase